MKWPKWLSIWFPLFWIFDRRSKTVKDAKKSIAKDVGATAAHMAVRLAAIRDHAREVQDAEYQKACLDFKAFLDQCFLSCSEELEAALANNLFAYHRFKYKIDDPAVVQFLKPIANEDLREYAQILFSRLHGGVQVHMKLKLMSTKSEDGKIIMKTFFGVYFIHHPFPIVK